MYGRKALHNQIEEDKNMKKRTRKLLTMVCCAVALVVISVGATLAYLTDTESVTNTFTVGNVNITLDELKTGTDGVPVTPNERISGNRENENYTNKYHLLPGESYTKDPTVHVVANSESCWLFVKVVNGIADIEAEGDSTIAKQMEKNGWKVLDATNGIYFHEDSYDADADEVKMDFVVFETFTVGGSETATSLASAKDVVITAYAIQKSGFNTAADAWSESGWAN